MINLSPPAPVARHIIARESRILHGNNNELGIDPKYTRPKRFVSKGYLCPV